MDPAAPGTARELIARHGFRIKKSLGQNFLVDANIIRKIVSSVAPEPGETIVEIGPGLGALTRSLAQKAGRVLAIEIDRNLLPILEETLSGFENVHVIESDALKTDFDRLVYGLTGDGTGKYKVAANLPYYITSPLIMHLLENRFSISRIVIMVQEEVARRITAAPGSEEYGALTVAANYYAKTEMLFRVPRTVFIPRPEVGSAVVRMEVRDKAAVEVADENDFFTLVGAAFRQRRKTLLNALSGSVAQLTREQWSEVLRLASIEPGRRGETLDIMEFARLASEYRRVVNKYGLAPAR